MSLLCGSCGAELPEGRITCPRCGAPATEAQFHAPRRYASPPPPQSDDSLYISHENAPLSVWGFLWSDILFRLPIVGVIVQIVWAFGGTHNRNRRHYAIARLIWTIIGTIVFILGIRFFFHELRLLIDNLLTHLGQVLS